MSTKFFSNFNTIYYRFGDNEASSIFHDLSQYVDLVDQIKTRDVLLEDYTILPNERPDQVSFKLYGSTDYYWLFYLLNDHIRQSGWPVAQQEIYSYAEKYYPHRVVTMKLLQGDIFEYDATGEPIFRTKIIGTPPDEFEVGQVVTGNLSGTFGTIIKRDLSLGQLVIDTAEAVNEVVKTRVITPNSNGIYEFQVDLLEREDFSRPLVWTIRRDGVLISGFEIEIDKLKKDVKITNIDFTPNSTYTLTYYVNRGNLSDGKYINGEEISYPNPAGGATSGIVYKETPQFLAVHHYEDADGNWVDIDPFSQDVGNAIPITYLERLINKNAELKQIKVLKPESAQALIKEFYELMNE
jgi:hypothetical protein